MRLIRRFSAARRLYARVWVAPVIAFALVTPVSTAQSPAQASADRQPTTPSFAFGPDEPAPALKQGKVLRASRVAVPPVIDGSLHDEAWTLAETASDYVQRDPDNGAAMTEVTRIQVVYDDRYIYVAIHCGDSSPAAIAGGLSRRDQLPSADHVTVAFDPRHDHLTAYVFQTNPSAVQADLSLSDDDREDRDYNAVWEVRTHVGGDGWTAEFRIPFSQMRFEVSELPGQVWGFQAERHILRKAERGTWVPKPRGRRGEVSLFGHLVFDTPLPAPDRVELLPYTLARAAHDTTAEAGRRSELGAAVGADVRLALGSAATLAVTVNPDFGHVEQDPAVLNLSVFETFYPEKRSFFLEDSRIFVPRAGLFQLFHSRRIGRVPGHFEVVDDHHVVRRQDHTTIVGAAKVTGKSGRWTYGALTAATGREYESVERQDGSPYSHLGEPLTSYNVVRVQRDMRSGSSNIGALATGVIRERSANAFTAGADYNLRWDENRGAVNGHWVVTRAPGDNGVRTSGGGVANFNFTRKHWNTWAHVDRFGRDFRVADLGFLRVRADRTDVDGGIHVEQPDPGKILRSYGGNLCGGRAWNREVVFDRWLCVNGFVSFLNFWRLTGGVTRRFDTLDDLDTRGGPAIVKPAATAYYFNVDSDARKSWQLNMSGDGKRGTQGDFEQALAVSLQLQASPPLQLSLSARHVRAIDIAQWIENREATREGVTDHIYGTLRRNVLDLALRGTYSIHRDLTLQTYVQPFVAVGDYEDIRRLARPRSYEFEAAAINADPDFNSKSVRSNVVLRWEYLRGSTLFLVWGLSQTDMSRPGRFSAMRDLRDTFRGPASHVLMAKMTYWLNR